MSLVKDVKEKHAKVMDHCSFVELTTVSKNTEAIKDLVDVSNLSKERQARLKEWDSDADISGWTTSIFDRINTSVFFCNIRFQTFMHQ